jgi:hypothetical protein
MMAVALLAGLDALRFAKTFSEDCVFFSLSRRNFRRRPKRLSNTFRDLLASEAASPGYQVDDQDD